MRLLLINPNTSAEITNHIVAVAKAVARPDTEIKGVTGRFGARYILTRAAAAVAAHAALDAYAREGAGADASVLACFGDPGLEGLRELARVPVVGMAEASCHMAVTLGTRFAIVTGGRRWGPMLEEYVTAIGLGHNLAAVKTLTLSGAEIAANPNAALDQLTDACLSTVTDHGAEAVILGGAGLAGIANRIVDRVPVPLVDCVAAAVFAAEGMARLGPWKALEGSHAPTQPVPTIGLGAELGALMERSTP
jgi:Asp/Glu/hydantoin racemase